MSPFFSSWFFVICNFVGVSDAVGALLVYDITDRESFSKVRNWVKVEIVSRKKNCLNDVCGVGTAEDCWEKHCFGDCGKQNGFGKTEAGG